LPTCLQAETELALDDAAQILTFGMSLVNAMPMGVLQYTYLITGSLVCLFLILLIGSSVSERRPRAVRTGLLLLGVLAVFWFGWYALLSNQTFALCLPLACVAIFLLMFFLPLGHSRVIVAENTSDRVDERDTMFAREEYLPGTDKYDRYYAAHPKLKKTDDRLRLLPELLEPGGRYYDAERSGKMQAEFAEIRDLTVEVDGNVSEDREKVDPKVASADLKQRLFDMGAVEVGITRLNPMFVYSHVGRGPEEWGSPIVNNHRYAVVFLLEMDYFSVESAPDLPITEEAVRRYRQAADISVELARQIRATGYPARAHISDSNYQIMLPPVGQDAGLGEVGRCGYLISPKYGPRTRLGAVTTDLPLIPDQPISFGVQDFCDKCVKCADNCPSSAIPKNGVSTVRGIGKWPLNVERCLHYWRLIGTDCGLCMKVCPYSHPSTLVHNIVRFAIRRSAVARTLSVWGDDLIYGRKTDFPRV